MKRSLGIRDAYNLYRQEVKNPKNRAIFLTVAEGFNKFMMDKLLEGQDIPLSEKLGRLVIIGRKVKPRLDDEGNIKGLAPNWKATNELWNKNPEAKKRKEVIFFFNEHTNGVRYRIHWTKKAVFIKYKDFISFRLSRENKHKINRAVTDGKQFLIE